MKKVLVIGYGVSGKASVALLKKMGRPFAVVDRNAVNIDEPTLDLALDNRDYPLKEIEQVILSPGIPPSHPIAERARERGIEVIGEIEFAFRHLKNRSIGITGTNGKTTVTLLVAHVLNCVGKKAKAVGNVGAALAEYLLNPDEKEILVVELSSYQLETLKEKKLNAAIFLNLTPDHLERYATLREYGEAKARIQDCLIPGGTLFVSKQVTDLFPDLFHIPFKTLNTVATISKLQYIRLGIPEVQNVEAAFALCSQFGVGREQFNQALESFRKPAHRIEWVGTVNGVDFYNDSKATNIDSVMHAMSLFEKPVVLILGGVDKGASYRPWIESFRGKVKKMVAYGEAAAKMEQELSSSFPFQKVKTMKEAVSIAKKEAKPDEVVLLSPGCSSYDQFRNYAERGEQFKELVKEIS